MSVKSGKKGYVLATTLVMMIVIFAISGVVLTIVEAVASSVHLNTERMERRLMIEQISNDYANLPLNNFCDDYKSKGYVFEQDETTYKLYGNDYDLIIVVNVSGENCELFNLNEYKSNEKLAEIKKQNGAIILWQYGKINS
ncbi:MAG: hypothetical protein ACI4TX_01145 [Christensenellales bacterium]